MASAKLILLTGATGGVTLRQTAIFDPVGLWGLVWNRRYEPSVIARDRKVKEALGSDGLAAESFNAALLHEPWTIQNQSKKPFQVFTPFWKHCLAKPAPAEPLPVPTNLPAPSKWLHQPHTAPAEILRAAEVERGHNYPLPVVSHAIAREVALEAFARIKGSAVSVQP